jgi:hypothetical protein
LSARSGCGIGARLRSACAATRLIMMPYSRAYWARPLSAGPVTLPGMAVPPGARVYLTTAISLAGVALATWCGMQAGAARHDRQWWALAAVAASVTAAGVPAYEQARKERMRARAQRAAVDEAVAMRVTMDDALDPIVRQLGRVATAASTREREALAEAAMAMVVDSAAHLAGTGRARACLFRFAPGRRVCWFPRPSAAA